MNFLVGCKNDKFLNSGEEKFDEFFFSGVEKW